jgi:hypothetical protein
MLRASVSLVAIMMASQAVAQSNDWTFTTTLYAWTPSVNIAAETPRGTVEGELSFSDLLDATDFAFMGAITAQKGRLGFAADVLYFDLSDSNATPGPAFDSATLESQINVTNIYAMYEVMGGGDNRIDVGIGYRFYQTDNVATLSAAARPDVSASASDNWSDPLIAARYRGTFADNMFGQVLVDYGGFLGSQSGSDLTWQGLATFGYQFNDSWTLQVGYRYLVADRSKGANDIEVNLSGPVVGVSFTF